MSTDAVPGDASPAGAEPTASPPMAAQNFLTPFLHYSPVLRLAEDLVPGGGAAVLLLAAVSLAVIVQNLMTAPPTSKTPPTTKQKGEPKRRRDDKCDLALLPDGSKDKSNRAWRRELSPTVYASLREGETDPPNLPPEEGGLDDDAILPLDGVYRCAGCGSDLYDNDTRFEAGCGWPCFFTCLPGAVRERHDADGERMELICNACNGHLGHVFRNESWDLPPPAERHCVNGRSLTFVELARAGADDNGGDLNALDDEDEEEWEDAAVDPIDDVE